MLKTHVHKPRTPQACTPRRIAAEVTARFDDDARCTEPAGHRDAAGSSARRQAGMGVGKPTHLHLRHADMPARCARDVPIMTISVVPPGVMTGVARMSVPRGAVMRPCSSRGG